MAILHRATLTPPKLELLAAHVMKFPSLVNTSTSEYSLLGAYRFDDPAGKVGMEAHLVSTGLGPVVHVPLTYREAPLVGADEWLIATTEHSFLGTRWIYNACGDPVYVQELVRAILTGGSHVEQFIATDDGPVPRPSTASAIGSGAAGTPVPLVDSVRADFDGIDTVITAGGTEIVVRHMLTDSGSIIGRTLTGTWPGNETPIVLACVRS
jgi:Maltokinase N-terminal cap domain